MPTADGPADPTRAATNGDPGTDWNPRLIRSDGVPPTPGDSFPSICCTGPAGGTGRLSTAVPAAGHDLPSRTGSTTDLRATRGLRNRSTPAPRAATPPATRGVGARCTTPAPGTSSPSKLAASSPPHASAVVVTSHNRDLAPGRDAKPVRLPVPHRSFCTAASRPSTPRQAGGCNGAKPRAHARAHGQPGLSARLEAEAGGNAPWREPATRRRQAAPQVEARPTPLERADPAQQGFRRCFGRRRCLGRREQGDPKTRRPATSGAAWPLPIRWIWLVPS